MQTSLHSAPLAARGKNVHLCPTKMDIFCPLQNGHNLVPGTKVDNGWTKHNSENYAAGFHDRDTLEP